MNSGSINIQYPYLSTAIVGNNQLSYYSTTHPYIVIVFRVHPMQFLLCSYTHQYLLAEHQPSFEIL